MKERNQNPEAWGRLCRAFVSNAILLFCLSPVSAAADIQFAGGTGEPNDPYRIATAEQLISIGSDPNLLSRHFVLVADIDLDPNLPGGKVFTKAIIAPSRWDLGFSGSLDGAGHVIRNLTIDGVVFHLGLFGYVAPSGTIKNLGVENVSITGTYNVGGLVASNDGTLSSCHSTGRVIGVSIVGGLAGENDGTISSCHSTATVTASGQVGGLVGNNLGNIISCHATGDVTGRERVGGLLGHNEGSVTSCHSTATVTASGQVGGLVGDNLGAVVSCHASGSVTGHDTLGGLLGHNSGPVLRSYATGDVTSTVLMPGLVGGLVGRNYGGQIRSCYATGSVIAEAAVGGLVGSNGDFLSTIACCYSTGAVTAIDPVFFDRAGGLVGQNLGMVSSCYSTSKVAGWESVGGLVGSNTNYADQITSSYFLSEWEGGGPDNGLGTVLTSGQMRQQESFVGFHFWASAAQGTDDEWWMPADGVPILVWQADKTGLQPIPDVRGLTLEQAAKVLAAAGLALLAEGQGDYDRAIPAGLVLRTAPASFATPGGTVQAVVCLGPYDWGANPGNGTEARPFQIETASQLDGLVDQPGLWGMHFVLTADIDLAGRTYSKALIAPDVDDSKEGFQGTAFTGSLDGQGFKILNLQIVTRTNDYLGLFGFIANGATVRRVELVNARIKGESGSYYVGTVAGYNAGTITDCSARGAVSGHKGYVDQLVGGNEGVIENCYTAVSRMSWGGTQPAH